MRRDCLWVLTLLSLLLVLLQDAAVDIDQTQQLFSSGMRASWPSKDGVSLPFATSDCSGTVRALVDHALSKWADISAVSVREAVSLMKAHGGNKLAGLVLRVEHGQLFVVKNYPGYQSRNDAMLLLVWAALQDASLQNVTTTLVINTQDRNTRDALHVESLRPRPVVFSSAQKVGDSDILIPDFSFLGWPEIGHKSWRLKHQNILRAGDDISSPFVARKPVALFAGRQLGNKMRVVGEQLARANPDLLLFTSGISNERQCGYKYLLYLEGGNADSGAYSNRLQYMLLCGSVVLMPHGADGPTWDEWFFPAFRPWRHYVPFKEDLSDLVDMIRKLQRDDGLSERIGRAGRELAEEVLAPSSAMCFLRGVLGPYASAAPKDDFAAEFFARDNYAAAEEIVLTALASKAYR